jgi:hypothetical protein
LAYKHFPLTVLEGGKSYFKMLTDLVFSQGLAHLLSVSSHSGKDKEVLLDIFYKERIPLMKAQSS